MVLLGKTQFSDKWDQNNQKKEMKGQKQVVLNPYSAADRSKILQMILQGMNQLE